ncbi:MAG: SIMPL domain-containing protein [Hoeflea sp.]|uniref:SIMPL domain-containing protein n=1 Tax=Hoeflea sp. TaxID=1940281 RepID=UPI0032EFB8CC
MTLRLPSRRPLVAGVLAASVIAAGLMGPLLSARADDATAAKPGVITVSAEGVTAIAPDMAVISLTVLREAETAREALDANNQAMNEVLAAMKDEGIAERDLQTGGFSIQPRWVYPDNNTQPREAPSIVGYQVQNTLTVRVRDLDRLGAILDTSVSLGVNQGGNIVFTNDDQESIRDQARADAVSRARAKAAQMTEALGVSLGRVTQISENQRSGQPVPMMRAEMAAMSAKGSDAVPVASGESEYRVTVSVTWEIDQ